MTLSWTSTNADFCAAGEDWSGDKPVQSSGTLVGPLDQLRQYSFRLRCTNSAGSDAETVTANVDGPVLPVCSPTPQNKQIGEQTSFNVTPASGMYTWTAQDGNPAGPVTVSGSAGFSTAFSSAGTKTVTVRSTTTNQTGTCTVHVSPTDVPPLDCDGPPSVAAGADATFTATGGTNGDYSWTGGGTPGSQPSGASFTTKWQFPGQKTVTVSRGGAQDTCRIEVTQAQPDPSQGCTINVSSNAPTSWRISGPTVNGNFIHSPNYANPVQGATHTTDDSGNILPRSGGLYTIRSIPAEAGGWSDPEVVPESGDCSSTGTLNFNINYATPPQSLTCSPPDQFGNVGIPMNFVAAGGTGNYSWSAPGGSPGQQTSGSEFSTRYLSPGSKTVTLSDGASTDTCDVAVFPVDPEQPVFCVGPEELNVNEDGEFHAQGGNGIEYLWATSAQGWGQAIPATGSGMRFTTRFTHPGGSPKRVTVGSGTRQNTCLVDVVAGATHSECVNNACVQVGGDGPDRCSVNADCGGGSGDPPAFRGVCDSAQRACVNRAGSGGGTCFTDPQCTGTTLSHLVCQSGRWVIVGGPGPSVPGAVVGQPCSGPGGTCDFSATPALISKGNSSTLDWTCAGAGACTVTDTLSGAQVGSGTGTGSASVSPESTTPYNLSCDSGAYSASTTVRVFSIIEVPPR